MIVWAAQQRFSFPFINIQGQQESNTDQNHYHRCLLLHSHLVPLCRLELCPHRGLSTCYSAVTNLFSGRTAIFLFLGPLHACLCQDIPIMSLPVKVKKNKCHILPSFSLGFGLQTPKQKSKELDIFGSSCFINVGIKPRRKTNSFQAHVKQLQK